jgi:hypothetical protein
MTPDEVLDLYTALKLHFTTSYDFFKYNGKLKARKGTYEDRHDRGHLFRLSRKYQAHEIQGVIIANLLKNPVATWPGSLINDESAQIYNDWLAVQNSLSYSFKTDMNTIRDSGVTLTNLFLVQNGQHPELLKMFLGKKIKFETMIILLKLLQMQSYWDKLIEEQVVWPDVSRIITKYEPFMTWNRKEMGEIMKNSLDIPTKK